MTPEEIVEYRRAELEAREAELNRGIMHIRKQSVQMNMDLKELEKTIEDSALLLLWLQRVIGASIVVLLAMIVRNIIQ